MFSFITHITHLRSDLLRSKFIDIPYQIFLAECNKFPLLGSVSSHLELPFWTSLLASF